MFLYLNIDEFDKNSRYCATLPKSRKMCRKWKKRKKGNPI